MNQTGTFVNLSRDRLGPDPAPAHGIRYVERDGNRYRAYCRCGWSKKRRVAEIAREALKAHIVERMQQS